MRDQVFTGKDVAEAVETASRALGIDAPNLKYVVLEKETPGRFGQSPSPARIAVLLDNGRPDRATPPTERYPRPSDARSTEGFARPRSPHPNEPASPNPQAGMNMVMRAIADAAGIDVATEVEKTERGWALRVSGADASFFHEPTLHQAVDHLMQRMFASAVAPERLLFLCDGYRESRDAALTAMARELAAAVRKDGQPRQTQPLNGYERRIVHIASSEEPGIRSFSVGESTDRRVTIALADPPADLAGD